MEPETFLLRTFICVNMNDISINLTAEAANKSFDSTLGDASH